MCRLVKNHPSRVYETPDGERYELCYRSDCDGSSLGKATRLPDSDKREAEYAGTVTGDAKEVQ